MPAPKPGVVQGAAFDVEVVTVENPDASKVDLEFLQREANAADHAVNAATRAIEQAELDLQAAKQAVKDAKEVRKSALAALEHGKKVKTAEIAEGV